MECVKRSYLTKKEAIKKIVKIQAEEGKHKKPIRSYKCEKCGNFHLTSWSKRVKNKIDNKIKFRTINRIEREAEYWKKKKGWELT